MPHVKSLRPFGHRLRQFEQSASPCVRLLCPYCVSVRKFWFLTRGNPSRAKQPPPSPTPSPLNSTAASPDSPAPALSTTPATPTISPSPNHVGAILVKEGFTPNYRKTRQMHPAQRQHLTGLTLKSKKPISPAPPFPNTSQASSSISPPSNPSAPPGSKNSTTRSPFRPSRKIKKLLDRGIQ